MLLLHLKMKRLLLIYLFLASLSYSSLAAEQVNPFAQFAGKAYGSYHYALRDSLRKRYNSRDYKYAMLAVEQLKSLPDKLHDKQWKLESMFLSANFVHDYCSGSDSLFVHEMLHMLKMSEKCGNKVFQIRIIRRLLDLYFDANPIEAIGYARLLEKAMPGITVYDYPDILDCKYRLAELYMAHKDYVRAEKYCIEIVAYPVYEENQRIFIHARNVLALIQRDYYHNLDLSDKWFLSIVAFHRKYGIKELPDQWLAIVDGELGRNQLLRRNYVKSEPLMEKSFKLMYACKDYSFSFYMACSLANCCCGLKEYAKALLYIQLADSCHKYTIGTSRENYYCAKSKYYSGRGHVEQASIYLDSAFYERNKQDLAHNMVPFLQIEQKMGQFEYQQKSLESKSNYHKFLYIFIFSIIIFIIHVSYIVLYFKKRNAYRELVLKNQELASGKQSYSILIQNENKKQDEEENDLLKEVHNYLENSNCYCNSEITLDSLSKDLGVNRTYLSSAINKTDDNFNTLINRYRVRYAIRILSQQKSKNIEDIALLTGFNNRKSFYNAFKLVTGLSPTDFRNNMQLKQAN